MSSQLSCHETLTQLCPSPCRCLWEAAKRMGRGRRRKRGLGRKQRDLKARRRNKQKALLPTDSATLILTPASSFVPNIHL